jgi:hypothetical protein
LKFKYINFESNSILWIAATINGEKIVYINDNLYRAVDGIDINPQDFRAIARERYQIDLNDLQEMAKKTMNKNIFRLTEGDLKKLVMESVKNILREWDADEYEGRMTDMNDDRAYQEDLHARREKQIEDYYQDKYRRLVQKYPGKSREWYEAMVDIFESKNSKKTIKEETFQNNQGYSHFAVNKATNKIVNGWDYSEYDPSELRQFKKDYFDVDMVDYGFNPKDYKIVTGKYLLRQGIDPNDNNNWANA